MGTLARFSQDVVISGLQGLKFGTEMTTIDFKTREQVS